MKNITKKLAEISSNKKKGKEEPTKEEDRSPKAKRK